MNMREPDNQSSPQASAIGDQNVERLLANAYQPETLDPEFVQRVHARAGESAREHRREAATSPADSIVWRTTSWGLAAVSIALAVVLVAGYFVPNKADYYRDGELIWINGRPYAPAKSDAPDGGHAAVLAPVSLAEASEQGERNKWLRIGNRGLTPRQRPAGSRPVMAAIGDSLTTSRGERRRVELPDKSVLYLNEKASVTVDEDRRITVESGEVFVEVSPADAHGGNQFVVATPQREVTALGTKFAVNVNADGTDVAVTQGKVKITGVERMLLAGQQIRGNEFSPLPRASHVLYWTRELTAAAESPLIPASDYGGGALVAVDPNGQQTKLSLRKYGIDIHIEDGFARTTIDQTYFNHEQRRLEGTFYFPLPPDASISRLAMYVNGRLMEGGMAEREHARDVFETIKYRSLDPALLEWVDGSTFKMRVFPLEARQEKRIVLSYTQRLDNNYGSMQYRFPAGHNMDLVRDWSARLHVDQGQALQWKCTSHELQADPRDGHLTLTARAQNVKPDRDLVVSLSDEGQDADRASELSRFSTVEHEGSQYLMLRFRPELPVAEQRQRRDWVFLLESDGSRDPLLARVQVDIVKTLLENAEHDDTFSIVTAGTRVHAFAAEQQAATPENIAAAIEFLESMHLVGALDLGQALTAAGSFAQAADRPVLVHVGAGIPILGERQTGKLLETLAKDVPYVGVGVGKRWNRQFMKSAASRTGGYFTQINPDEPVAWRAFELGAALNTPRLMDIRVEPDAAQGEFLCVKDWVSHGEEFCAVAQLKPGQPAVESVTVSGSVNGEAYRRTIPVENVAGQAEYLPRTWAKLAIDDMLARDAEANKSRIIELSKSMYVMSPFTSLLVLENDEMYGEYNVDRGRQDHWALYPCPAEIEVVHEPLHGPQPAVTAETDDKPVKPSVEEVLQTLLARTLDLGDGTSVRVEWTPHFVTVPDGGTVQLGGIRRSVDVNGNGVPTFSNLPYVNRLFKNASNGRETPSLMLMVTPRIIIQEEEEEVLLFSETMAFHDRRTWDVDDDGDGVTDEFGIWIDLINSTIVPEAWDDVGGPGTIDAFPTNLSLVIGQTQQVQGQMIREFESFGRRVDPVDNPFMRRATLDLVGDLPTTAELRDFLGTGSLNINTITDSDVWSAITGGRGRYLAHRGFAPAGSLYLETIATPEHRILVQLGRSTEFIYQQQPLQEVIADLRLRLGIPIQIHSEAIEKHGVRIDAPITLLESDITLRSALNQMLAQLDLTYFITDGVLQITTAEDIENQLVSRNYNVDEMLLLIQRGSTNSTGEYGSALNDPRRANRWAQILNQRIAQSAEQPNLLYPQSETVGHRRSYRRLVAFAPATATTNADALAVIDAEARLEDRPKLGEIDQRARELIEAARGWDWQLITLRDQEDRVVLAVTMDGQGRFRFDHRTEHGLRETVVCDGLTLRHLYPELGLGTTRRMSRFHRAELTQLVPWLLPPVEDLAVGADLRLIGPRTIAIAPHAVGETNVRLHLEFAEDGRLARRSVVEMPSGKTIVSVAYSADGTVRWLDGDNKQLGEFHISVEKAAAPDLQPDVDALVVLPMPVRSRDNVYKMAKESGSSAATAAEKNDALRAIASDAQNPAADPARWSEEDALRLLATYQFRNENELRDVIGRRFFARGDRRLGFYTLLLSSGQRWDVDQRVPLGDGTTTRMDPLSDHPNSTLARYIDCQLRRTRFDLGEASQLADESPDRFILQLAQYQQLAAHWSLPSGPPGDAETRRRELDELFGFLSRCNSPRFAYTLLRRLQRRYGDAQPHGRIAEALIELEKQGTVSYAVKYALARSLASSGEKEQAQALFIQLYREALDAGVLPPIDQAFVAAVQESENPFDSVDNGEKGFSGLMRGACAQLVQRKQRPLAIALAWQCRQLNNAKLGDMLVDQALTGVPEDERLGTTLAALEYLAEAGKHDRADTLLETLLSNPLYGESPAMWRLASRVASDGGRLARSVSHLERAMDLEYQSLLPSYDVEQVRGQYHQLFASYRELAQVVAAPESDIPLDLVARTIEAADRWRSLETDVTAACNGAASVLGELGEEDLAWDYLTTPLASKPNEAAAWLDLAQTLRNDGKLELAGRAYETAYEAEPTNAQILWDHAQLLEQAGRGRQARALYRQIADNEWQPRFNHIKGKAEQIKARHSD